MIKKTFEIQDRSCQEFAKLLRSLEQLIQRVKGQNNFWYVTECLFPEVSHIQQRTVRIQIGKKYWDLETCRKS